MKPGTKVGRPEIIFPRLDISKSIEKLLALEPGTQPATKSESEGKQKVDQIPDQKPAAASEVPAAATQAPSPVPAASEKISIEDFAKVELRVGEVLAAERIPKADKLLKLQVDIGTEVRQVLAGIAQYYEPEKLVGMKVVVVTNLQPRKMRGLESNGMIVAASVGEEGKPVLATFVEDVPKGSKLR